MKAKVQRIDRTPAQTQASRALAPDSAGCLKCDAGMAMDGQFHHVDGSVCVVIQRNRGYSTAELIAPMGRYAPAKDGFR